MRLSLIVATSRRVNPHSSNWPSNKRDIKTFYTHLEQELIRLEQRLAEFSLMKDERDRPVSNEDVRQMLGRLTRQYVQHLARITRELPETPGVPPRLYVVTRSPSGLR